MTKTPKTEEFTLTPKQIQKIAKLKHLNLDPAYGGILVMPGVSEKIDADTRAVVKTNGMEIRITMAEAFKL